MGRCCPATWSSLPEPALQGSRCCREEPPLAGEGGGGTKSAPPLRQRRQRQPPLPPAGVRSAPIAWGQVWVQRNNHLSSKQSSCGHTHVRPVGGPVDAWRVPVGWDCSALVISLAHTAAKSFGTLQHPKFGPEPMQI